MFEELVPPELREQLDGAFGIRRMVQHALAWAHAIAIVPHDFDALMDRELVKMERRAWTLVDRYRRGEITLCEFERELEAAFDFSGPAPPEFDALVARGPFPRRP